MILTNPQMSIPNLCAHPLFGRPVKQLAVGVDPRKWREDNVTDMFPPRPWGPEELGSYCKKHWDIQPQSEWFRPWWRPGIALGRGVPEKPPFCQGNFGRGGDVL